MVHEKIKRSGTAALAAMIILCACLFFTVSAEAASYKRIVSLYAGHTDNIVALGGEKLLVAVSKSDSGEIAPSAVRLPLKVGAEKVLSLKPDLIVTRTFAQQQNPELYSILERSGVKVVLLDPPTWEGFREYLKTLASLVGVDPTDAEKKLKKITDEIAAKAAKQTKKGRKPKVFVEATSRELHTCAPQSWAAHLVSLAGGVNAASGAVPIRKGSPIAAWGLERILKMASKGLDVYIIQRGAMNMSTAEDFAKRNWFAAVKKAEIAVVPEGYLSRPSLLGIEKGGAMLLDIFEKSRGR